MLVYILQKERQNGLNDIMAAIGVFNLKYKIGANLHKV